MGLSSTETSIEGRYRVLELLGRGGMGAVYRVCDEHTGKEVALKRLLRGASDELQARLFEREFHTLTELAHPRIIEVYDYGVDAAGAYYTMELLGGQDLRELGKLEWRKACALLRDVASSLAILHSRRLLHGDLSPRNVRCTADGRAKLLDFGAMMPMGVAKRVVGTPPFIAPEMVQLQPLDGRADLFALGALGYFLLTGAHAYPARSVHELRDVWRTAPHTPRELAPETPAALSQFIMELLQFNPATRPRTAGIVMERLCAIASLPFEEQADVAEAYLTTPSLVGRDEALANVRRQLLSAARGAGHVLLVQGGTGSGRSRFLDGCVLEAKLQGSHVLRADAGDSNQGPYGVAAALCRQLFQVAPVAARRSAHLHGAVLAHVIGSQLAGASPVPEPPPRHKLLAALRDLMLSAARSLRLVIAVDDVDRIDDASASLLVALAQKAKRRPLCLIATLDSSLPRSPALDLLIATGESIALGPLTEGQTEQLLRSVFGDVNHLVTVARRIHGIAQGNPRAIMQLATHLVEQGIARYDAGSFILPARIRDDDLPRSLAATLERRTAALEPDALELARVLALTDPSELPIATYPELTSHRDRARTYRAIDRLVCAQLLEQQGDRYRVTDPALRSVLTSGLTAEERAALHARLSRAFEPAGSVSRRAHHLMESAQPEAAIRVLLAQFLKDPNEPRDPLEDYVPGMLDLLERAAEAADALRLPAPLRMELRMKTAGASQFLGDLERFMRLAPPTLAQLHRESGLADYEELDPSLERMARLTEALSRAQQRYDATPEAERGLSPVDAIRELARSCAMFAAVSILAFDPELLEQLPSLEPLQPLSPAISAIQLFIDGVRAMVLGQTDRSCELLRALLERVSQPDGAGLGELYRKSLHLGTLYILGLAEASSGLPNAGERVIELEREPGHRVNAQRVQALSHLMQCNAEEAAAAQRRAELVMLQDGQQQRYPDSALRSELLLCELTEDLARMKLVTEQITAAIPQFPKWHALLPVSRCHYRRLQGDYAGALEALTPVLDVDPLRNRDWSMVVSAHVTVLRELGRAAEAAEIGCAAFAYCEQRDLRPSHWYIALTTSRALIAVGRVEEARRLVERTLAEASAQGVRGLVMGYIYEVRAHVAIAQADGTSFRHFAELCATEYRIEHNPALAAKHARLVHGAVEAGVIDSMIQRRSSAPHDSYSPPLDSVRSRLLECQTLSERARCALLILSEHMSTDQAFIYGLREGQATLLASLRDSPPPEQLTTSVQRFVERELQFEAVTSLIRAPRSASGALQSEPVSGHRSLMESMPATLATDVSGRGLYPMLLSSRRDGQLTIAGVVVLRFAGVQRSMPSASLLTALADALISYDDVDAVTCIC